MSRKAVLACTFAGMLCAAAPAATAADETNPCFRPEDRTRGQAVDSNCFVLGLLTVPFKAELTGNKDVFGSASLGGFVGYNLGRNFIISNLTLLGFAGYSQNLNATSSNNNTNTSPSSNTGAVSYGVGFAFPVGNTFSQSTPQAPTGAVHVGVIVGWDHTSEALGYAYNDKPWISILLGTSF